MPLARLLLACWLLGLIALASSQSEVVVKPGDTLWSIAKRYGVTPDAILGASGLTGTDLFPGAVLKLPPGSSAAPETYTVRTGDNLYDIAAAFDLSLDELIAINHFDGATLRPGDVLRVRAAAGEPPAPLVVTVQPGDTLWSLAQTYEVGLEALQSANGIAAAKLKPGDRLTIPGRFAGSQADQGGTAAPTVQVARGDTLWDIARQHNTTVTALMAANGLASQSIRVGQTLRLVPGNELLRATPVTGDQPALAPAFSMVWPLVGAITSRFGYRQLRIGGSNFHAGLDIDGDTGDPILAASAGIVTYSGWRGGFGNLVVIEANGSEYFYAHCSQLLVSVGEVVNAGQTVALVGSTGASTGSHLHFEVRVNGQAVDPLPILEQQASRP